MRLQSLVRNSSMLQTNNGDHVNLFPYAPHTYLDPTTARPPKQTGAPTKRRLKLPIPADKYPEYNFVGRLLGPRGATLKAMEKETGCKIMIRGKGSIRKDKEGEVRGKPGYEHVFSEPLHVVIEAEMEENASMRAVFRAKEEIEHLLVPVPEDRDQLKKQQLRDLAIMNGTLRSVSSSSFPSHYQELSSDLNLSNLHSTTGGASTDTLDEMHFPLDDIAADDHLSSAQNSSDNSLFGGGHASPSTMRPNHFSLYDMSTNLPDPGSAQLPTSEGIAIERRALTPAKGIDWSSASSVPSVMANSQHSSEIRASSPIQWGSSFAGFGGLWGTQEPMSYQANSSTLRSKHTKEQFTVWSGTPVTETSFDPNSNNQGDDPSERKM